MPVTKRMNNLHIAVMDNGSLNGSLNGSVPLFVYFKYFTNFAINSLHDINDPLIGRQTTRLESQSIDVQNIDNWLQRNQSSGHSVNGISQNCVHNCLNGLSVYSPQLDSNSNLIYYESNRILFEAHQQRLQRMATTSRHLFFFRKS